MVVCVYVMTVAYLQNIFQYDDNNKILQMFM